MTRGRRESWRSTAVSAALAVAAAAPRTPRASLPTRRKKRRKNRGGEITPIRLRRRLRRQPRPTRPGRLRSARRPQAAPGCRARGAFVLSKRAVQDARALRADELRPRSRDGVSWSQIRCLHGRCVRRGCERVAQPKTAARTADKSLLPCAFPAHVRAAILLPSHCFPAHFCSLLFGIVRGGWGGPEQVSAHRPPFSLGLTTSAVRRSSCRPPGSFRCGERKNEPMLRKGNVLYCTNRGTFYIALTAGFDSLTVVYKHRKLAFRACHR